MTTIKTYEFKKESFGNPLTFSDVQRLAMDTGLTITELAEGNDCSCGYELLKKMQSEGY